MIKRGCLRSNPQHEDVRLSDQARARRSADPDSLKALALCKQACALVYFSVDMSSEMLR